MSQGSQNPDNPVTATAERLKQELDRWLETAWTQGERAWDAVRRTGKGWSPALDIIESPDAVRVLVDLPAVDPESIDLTLAGNLLTIQGERLAVQTGMGESIHVTERPKGAFSRTIPLPVAIEADQVTADVHAGVLEIQLPKADTAKAKHIRVNIGGGSSAGGQ
jgi:HSP20 family protein